MGCTLQARASNDNSCVGGSCAAAIGVSAEAALEFPSFPSFPSVNFCGNSVDLNSLINFPTLPGASAEVTLYSRNLNIRIGNCGATEAMMTAAYFANATD